MSRPRDSQQSKVLNALQDVERVHAPELDMKTLQKHVDRLVRSAWFKRRAHKSGEKYSVLFVPHPNADVCSFSNYCPLGEGHRNMLNVLHAIAHYMLPLSVAWHGPEFAKLMLELVGHVGLDVGPNSTVESRKAERLALKDAYATYNVRWKVYSEEARAGARARWLARDLKGLHDELREEVTP